MALTVSFGEELKGEDEPPLELSEGIGDEGVLMGMMRLGGRLGL